MVGLEPFGTGLGMVLIWLIPILLIALVIRNVIGDRGGKPERMAQDILEARYVMRAVKSIGMSS